MGVNKEVSITIRARDMASATFKKLGASVSRMGTNMRSTVKKFVAGFSSGIRTAGLMVTGFITTLGYLGKKVLDVAGDFQKNRVAFETMTGSAEVAKKTLKDLTDFAKKTPFDLRGVTEQAKKLMAYGIEADDLIPTIEMLGNIAAGVGVDKLPQLTLAFGQVRAVTRLTGMELRQFTEAGVPLLELLGEQLGKTVGEVQDMVSAGQISFDNVKEALASTTAEGGKFFDLMEKQSETLPGRIANIKDSIEILAARLIGITEEGDVREGSIFWYLSNGAETFQLKLDELSPKIENFIKQLEANKEIIIALAGAIVGILVLAVVALVIAIGWIPIAITIAAGVIGAAVALILTHWDTFKKKVEEIADYLEESLPVSIRIPFEIMTFLIGKVMKNWESLRAKVVEVRDAVKNFFSSETGQKLFNIGSGTIFGRQFGGFVNAGQPYVVGERGPELFVPSSAGRVEPNLATAGGGGDTYNANVYVGMYAGTALEKRRIAEEIMNEFKYLAASRGRTVEEEITT